VSARIARRKGAATGGTVAGERIRECGDDGDGGYRSGSWTAIHPKAANAIPIELAKGRVWIEGSADVELLRVVPHRTFV